MKAAFPLVRRLTIGLVVGALTVVALDFLFPPPIERGRIVSSVVEDRNGVPLRAFPIAEGRWRLGAPLEDIDPAFLEALIAIEDKRFYRHFGVDPAAVARAAADVVRRGEVTSGASTITMQTARLLEPRPRTIPSKIIEMVRAIQIERHLTKSEILELYLTLTPYGGNLEGVRAASWAWLGREPDALTPDQIALLIALPQAPEARRPDRRSAVAKSARADILARLSKVGVLEYSRAADAATETLPSARHPFPAEAWHAAATVRSNNTTVRSTIDQRLQLPAERILRELTSEDPTVQASALIVDIETRSVRAAVGSVSRQRPGGWIDLTNRYRSPGSTLKPFIYAMAFDDGLATSGTQIADLPARFQAYQPENFDRTFRGEVTVRQALQHSLNVPAVHLLDALGTNRFLTALRFAGQDPVLPTETEVETGLAVALGGVGMTARDLITLYAGLGDGGVVKPLRWDENDPMAEGVQLVSSESAAEVLSILADAPAPPGRMPATLSSDAPQIAFKTGTSYGYRDAWAAGVGAGYAVVVWVGRPDGVPRPGVTGRKAALPALFDLFDEAVRSDRRARPQKILVRREPDTPLPLETFGASEAPPRVLFPPTDSDVWADRPGRSFVLSATGDAPLQWYADGEPLVRDANGAAVWTPGGAGFYRLVVVDAQGRSTATRVRVRTNEQAW